MGWQWPEHDRNVGKAGVRRNWGARDHNTRQSGGMRGGGGGGGSQKTGCFTVLLSFVLVVSLIVLPVVMG